MYTLYIANKIYSSWSLRPWVLMRELSISFSEIVVPFGPESNWDAFRQFSPAGKVPCLHDGASVVWDSLGITEFLAERHRGVWPEDGAARTWARCAAAEMHSGFATLRQQCPMHCGLRIRMADPSPAFQKDVDRLNELWSEGLSRFGGPFLSGEKFTAVDAFFAPVAFRVQTYGIELNEAATAYVQRILALDSMRDWAGVALKEVWREPGHEADALAAGSLLTDLRQG
jgi:glutathione S-transferase